MGDAGDRALGGACERAAPRLSRRRVGPTRGGSIDRGGWTAMASPVIPGSTDTNRVWRASTAETIDEDLATLWREVAREAPVSRAVMSNLVVFRARAADD